ncbi:MAG: ribosomal protein S18-alanine N-acetyltransferase [Lachnospiraceae bacterium]|nr:ribosomal protein S18-alanine N-acetyltransferase [Lachnospiraceae bacterium]
MDTEKLTEEITGEAVKDSSGEMAEIISIPIPGIPEMYAEQMQPSDIPEVAGIEQECFSQPWSENSFHSALEQEASFYLVVKTKETGRIAGYCGLLQSFDDAEILNVAVRKELRGRGIGYAMLRCLMELGGKFGIRHYTLEVRKGNAAALALYKKLGFDAAGIRRNFYRDPSEDAVIMWTK